MVRFLLSIARELCSPPTAIVPLFLTSYVPSFAESVKKSIPVWINWPIFHDIIGS